MRKILVLLFLSFSFQANAQDDLFGAAGDDVLRQVATRIEEIATDVAGLVGCALHLEPHQVVGERDGPARGTAAGEGQALPTSPP